MSTEADHYATLGVLPDAESVVIVAAYRALASLYHPDRWRGDTTVANKRMAEINVAYEVLKNPTKRKAYDSTRKSSHSYFKDSDSEKSSAFSYSLAELEAKWNLAVDIYPDLVQIRDNLKKTSYQLAFAFVTAMLESSNFSARHKVASAMEHSFLKQYFGSNREILDFVKSLILQGEREAVKAVNRYVDVLGSGDSASIIIKKVKEQFNIGMPRPEHEAEDNFKNTDSATPTERENTQIESGESALVSYIVLTLILIFLSIAAAVSIRNESSHSKVGLDGNTTVTPTRSNDPPHQPVAADSFMTIWDQIAKLDRTSKTALYEFFKSESKNENLEVFELYKAADAGKILAACIPNAITFYIRAQWDLEIKNEGEAIKVLDSSCGQTEGRVLIAFEATPLKIDLKVFGSEFCGKNSSGYCINFDLYSLKEAKSRNGDYKYPKGRKAYDECSQGGVDTDGDLAFCSMVFHREEQSAKNRTEMCNLSVRSEYIAITSNKEAVHTYDRVWGCDAPLSKPDS